MLETKESKKSISEIAFQYGFQSHDVFTRAFRRVWCEFIERVKEIHRIVRPMTMYGICEEETCKENHFMYMAAVAVDSVEKVPQGMSVRQIQAQKFFQASVPQKISTPDVNSFQLLIPIK